MSNECIVYKVRYLPINHTADIIYLAINTNRLFLEIIISRYLVIITNEKVWYLLTYLNVYTASKYSFF